MSYIATVVCVGFITLLFKQEFTRADRQRISWAPFCWMFIAGSRFVSVWLSMRGPGGVEAYSDGSPVDRAVFMALIVWGAVVLSRREIAWGPLLVRNKWLIAYLLYCLASVTWTDAPEVMIKRWIKDLGNPIMALIILTERDPYVAMAATLRRLAFLFVPLSALFIKYYPELGRTYGVGGFPTYTGVADQKNTLGLSCMLIGIAYTWSRLMLKRPFTWPEFLLLALGVWVMQIANSATAFTCLLVAIALFVCAQFEMVARRPTRIITVTTAVVCVYMLADSWFHLQDHVLGFLGRDETFTNRTSVWETVRSLQTSALVGTGFMTFWNGDRMAAVWAQLGPGINQAHNGYLEQYLNLGYVGVAFIIWLAVLTLWAMRRQLKLDYQTAILRLCLVLVALLYNYTEASFYGINNMWVLFLAAAINLPGAPVTQPAKVEQHAAPTAPHLRFHTRAQPVAAHAYTRTETTNAASSRYAFRRRR